MKKEERDEELEKRFHKGSRRNKFLVLQLSLNVCL